jgi:hypothetical protein
MGITIDLKEHRDYSGKETPLPTSICVHEKLTPHQKNPLCYADHAKDDICIDYSYNFDSLPQESDCVLEIHLQKYLGAVEMHPFYLPFVFPNTYNRSLWDAERISLAALLLDNAEKVRQLPAESRTWDFDSLALGKYC